MKRCYIIYSGQVQGVGFRWKIKNLSYKYNLTGYVKNLYDGNVEDYIVKQIDIVDDEKSFRVTY